MLFTYTECVNKYGSKYPVNKAIQDKIFTVYNFDDISIKMDIIVSDGEDSSDEVP